MWVKKVRLGWVVFCLWWFAYLAGRGLGLSAQETAQPAVDHSVAGELPAAVLRFQRVFVPADRLAAWPRQPGPYVPMDPKEFEALVQAAMEASSPERLHGAAYLRSAEYYARLEGGDLVDGFAVLEVAPPEGSISAPCTLPLEPLELATGQASWSDRDGQPARVGLTPDARWKLEVDGSGRLVFPWSLRGEAEGENAWGFRLRFPRSPSNTLVLDVPEGIQLRVREGLLGYQGAVSEKVHRWVILAGGQNVVEVKVTRNPGVLPISRNFHSQLLFYQVSSGGLLLRGQILLDTQETIDHFSLLADEGLNLRRVGVTGSARTVRFAEEPAGDQRRIHLQFTPPLQAGSHVIWWEASAPLLVEQHWKLPRVMCEQGNWRQTHGVVQVLSPLKTERFQISGGSQQPAWGTTDPGELFRACLEKPEGQIQLLLRFAQSRLRTTTISHVQISSREHRATIAIGLEGMEGLTWGLEAQVNPEWFVEDVRAIEPLRIAQWYGDRSQRPPRLRIEFGEGLAAGQKGSVIIRAKRLNPPAGRSFRCAELLPLQLVGDGPREEYFWIGCEPGEQVEWSDPGVLVAVGSSPITRLAELAGLASPAEVWEVPGRDSGLTFRLIPAANRYRLRGESYWQIGSTGFRAWHRFLCEPLEAAGVFQVRLAFSPGIPADLTWELLDTDGEPSGLAVSKTLETEGDSSKAGGIWKLAWPEPLKRPFILQARQESSWSGELSIGLLWGPGADEQKLRLSLRLAPELLLQSDDRLLRRIWPGEVPDWSRMSLNDAAKGCRAGEVLQFAYTPPEGWGLDRPAVIARVPPAATKRVLAWSWWTRYQTFLGPRQPVIHQADYFLELGGVAELEWQANPAGEIIEVSLDQERLFFRSGIGEQRGDLPEDSGLVAYPAGQDQTGRGGEIRLDNGQLVIRTPGQRRFRRLRVTWRETGFSLERERAYCFQIPWTNFPSIRSVWTLWTPAGWEGELDRAFSWPKASEFLQRLCGPLSRDAEGAVFDPWEWVGVRLGTTGGNLAESESLKLAQALIQVWDDILEKESRGGSADGKLRQAELNAPDGSETSSLKSPQGPLAFGAGLTWGELLTNPEALKLLRPGNQTGLERGPLFLIDALALARCGVSPDGTVPLSRDMQARPWSFPSATSSFLPASSSGSSSAGTPRILGILQRQGLSLLVHRQAVVLTSAQEVLQKAQSFEPLLRSHLLAHERWEGGDYLSQARPQQRGSAAERSLGIQRINLGVSGVHAGGLQSDTAGRTTGARGENPLRSGGISSSGGVSAKNPFVLSSAGQVGLGALSDGEVFASGTRKPSEDSLLDDSQGRWQPDPSPPRVVFARIDRGPIAERVAAVVSAMDFAGADERLVPAELWQTISALAEPVVGIGALPDGQGMMTAGWTKNVFELEEEGRPVRVRLIQRTFCEALRWNLALLGLIVVYPLGTRGRWRKFLPFFLWGLALAAVVIEEPYRSAASGAFLGGVLGWIGSFYWVRAKPTLGRRAMRAETAEELAGRLAPPTAGGLPSEESPAAPPPGAPPADSAEDQPAIGTAVDGVTSEASTTAGSEPGQKPQGAQEANSSFPRRLGGALGLLIAVGLCCGGLSDEAWGQGSGAARPRNDVTYRVLIPIDQERQPTGEKYQVPEALYQRLSHLAATARDRWIIRSARYVGRMVRGPEGQGFVIPALQVVYEVDVLQAPCPFPVPFGFGTGGVVGSASVNGRAVLLGGSVGGGAAGTLELPQPGINEVEIAVELQLETDLREAQVKLGVPPIAQSWLKLELPADAPRVEVLSSFGPVRFDPARGSLEAELGPVSEIILRWPMSDETKMAPEVDQLIWLGFDQGGGIAEIAFRFPEGTLVPDSLVLEAETTWELVSVNDRVAAETAELLGVGAGGNRIRIPLRGAAGGTRVVRSRWLWPTSAIAGNWFVPRIRASGVKVNRLFLGVSPPAGYQIQTLGTGYEALATHTFVEAWNLPVPPVSFAWSLTPEKSSWGIAVRPLPPKLEGTQKLRIILGANRIQWRLSAEITPQNHAVFQYFVKAPSSADLEDVQVTEASGPVICRRTQTPEGIRLSADSGLEERHQIDLHLSGKMEAGQRQVLPLVWIQWPEVRGLTLEVWAHRRLDVELAPTAAMKFESAELSPPEEDVYLLGTLEVANPEEFAAEVIMRRNEPRITGTQLTRMWLRDNRWLAEVSWQLRIENGFVEELPIQVPRWWSGPWVAEPAATVEFASAKLSSRASERGERASEKVETTSDRGEILGGPLGSESRRGQGALGFAADSPGQLPARSILETAGRSVRLPAELPENYRRIIVRFDRPVRSGRQLRISAPLNPRGGIVQLPVVRLEDAELESELVALPRTVEQKALVWRIEGLERLPPGSAVPSSVASAGWMVYRCSGQRRPSVALLPTELRPMVRFARFWAVLNPDGSYGAVGHYYLDPGGQDTFKLTIPERLTILAYRAEGSTWREAPENQAWQVRLPHALLPQRLEVVFLGRCQPQKAGTLTEGLVLAAPTLEQVSVRESLWCIGKFSGSGADVKPDGLAALTPPQYAREYLQFLLGELQRSTGLLPLLESEDVGWLRSWHRWWNEAYREAIPKLSAGGPGLRSDGIRSELAAWEREIKSLVNSWDLGPSESSSDAERGLGDFRESREMLTDLFGEGAWRSELQFSYWSGSKGELVLTLFSQRSPFAFLGEYGIPLLIMLGGLGAIVFPGVRTAVGKTIRQWPFGMMALSGLIWWLYLSPSVLGFGILLLAAFGGVGQGLRRLVTRAPRIRVNR